MRQFSLRRLTLLSSSMLLMLVSCTDQSSGKSSMQPTGSIVVQPSNSASIGSTEVKPKANQSQLAPATEARSTGNLLSPAQVAKLTRLPIPIVAPTDLPEGFRVLRADGDSGKYANGDDDSGYTIEYQSNDGACFAIYSSQDGPRRLKQIGQVESAVGTVKMYEETYEGRTSVQSFIPVKGNPVMISPVSQLNSATGSYEACRPLDRANYERILRSIELVK